MRGLIVNYSNLPSTMFCNCGEKLKNIHQTFTQGVFRCFECTLIVNYRRKNDKYQWYLAETTTPEIKPKVDVSVLTSVIMKLDAIANHLGVELVNVPEHFECEEDTVIED